MYPEVNRREFGILLGGFAAGHLLRPREARAEGGQPPEIAPAPFPVDQAFLRRYFAQGPYMDPAPWQNRVFQHTNSGALVVLSEQTSDEIQLPPLPSLTQQDGVLVTPEGSYLFRFDEKAKRDKVTLLTAEGEVPVEYPTTNPFYKPQTLWHDTLGMVGADTFRVTHTFNPQTASWSELESYVPLGTPEQRIRESLQDFLTEKYEVVNGNTLLNMLDLDLQEVAQYLRTGKDDGLTTFKVLPNAKGEPAIILVTGGKYGLRKDLGNIENVQKGVKRLNEIDPNIVDTLTTQFGLRAISGDVAPGVTFVQYPGYGTTLYAEFGVILFNEITTNNHYPPIKVVARLANESRGLYSGRHLEWRNNTWISVGLDLLSEDADLDKSLWLEAWVEKNKQKLSSQEFQELSDYATMLVAFFSKSS